MTEPIEGAEVRGQPDQTANDAGLTIEIIRQRRRPRKARCCIAACRCAGTIGFSTLGNRDWLCWTHYRDVEVVE